MDLPGNAVNEHFLAQVERLIDWSRLAPLVQAARDKLDSDVPLAAVKMLLVARWYGLTEGALLEACEDRLSFRRFVGMAVQDEREGVRHAEAYRRLALQAPAEAQGVVHAVESQLLAAGYVVRPGVSAEAAVMPVAPQPGPAAAEPPAAPRPEPAPDAIPQMLETAFFQPGELAELLMQGESAFVRGAARMAASPAFSARSEELTPPPTREIPPARVAVEWPWGLTTDLTERLRIGRDHHFCAFAGELQPYLHVSRRHAELTPCPEGVWVRDLKSRNGTYVNDEELPKGQAYLVDGDARVRFGPYCVLRLKLRRAEE
ncbi:MAG: FHA domain-containing protein [Burkholderiales bacterium]|nr:FHA domain-containing protein [Burkholderiales bacterium]